MASLDLNSTRTRLLSWARGYSPFQLFVAGLLAVVVVAGAVFAFGAMNRPSMTLLYGSLDPADTAKITQELSSAGIAYELGSGGSSVMVSAAQVDAARVSLASAGLPKKAAVGYEALDGQPLTTSKAREDQNIKRALEGNIANSLMQIDGVDGAQVQLAWDPGSNGSLYSDKEVPVTASVTLTTARTLSDDQAATVVALVAASVQGLDPSNVTVADATGRLLAGGGLAAAGSASAQGKATQAVQDQLTAKANAILSPLGRDKYSVQVAATLGFDQRTEQSEKFTNPAGAPCPAGTPAGTVCQLKAAEATSGEDYQATDPAGVGAATTLPNTVSNGSAAGTGTANGTTIVTGSGGASQTYKSTKDDAEYKVDRTVTSQVDAVGQVQRLSVAVVLDRSVPAAEVTQLRNAVSAAVGLDPARGDTITVSQIGFAKPAAAPVVDAAAVEQAARLRTWGTYAGIGLLLLTSLFLLTRLRGRREQVDPTSLAMPESDPIPVAAGRGRLEPDGGLRSDAEMLLARIDAAPRDAADVLRGWIADDQAGRA